MQTTAFYHVTNLWKWKVYIHINMHVKHEENFVFLISVSGVKTTAGYVFKIV